MEKKDFKDTLFLLIARALDSRLSDKDKVNASDIQAAIKFLKEFGYDPSDLVNTELKDIELPDDYKWHPDEIDINFPKEPIKEN